MNRIIDYVLNAGKFKILSNFEKLQIRLFWVNVFLMTLNLMYGILNFFTSSKFWP